MTSVYNGLAGWQARGQEVICWSAQGSRMPLRRASPRSPPLQASWRRWRPLSSRSAGATEMALHWPSTTQRRPRPLRRPTVMAASAASTTSWSMTGASASASITASHGSTTTARGTTYSPSRSVTRTPIWQIPAPSRSTTRPVKARTPFRDRLHPGRTPQRHQPSSPAATTRAATGSNSPAALRMSGHWVRTSSRNWSW